VSKNRKPREQRRQDRHVRLYYWFLDTVAWKTLPALAKVVYVGMVRHYNGFNNGKIGYSERQAGADAGVSDSTGWRMLRLLQERGFIVLMKRGAFSRKCRHASEWRLTEFVCDVTNALPTKDFIRWRPLENSEDAFTGEPARIHPRTRTGSLVNQIISESPPYAFTHEPANDHHGFTHGSLIVNQGEGEELDLPATGSDP